MNIIHLVGESVTEQLHFIILYIGNIVDLLKMIFSEAIKLEMEN